MLQLQHVPIYWPGARCLHLAGAHHVAGYACLPARQRGNNSHAHPLRQVRCGGVWLLFGCWNYNRLDNGLIF